MQGQLRAGQDLACSWGLCPNPLAHQTGRTERSDSRHGHNGPSGLGSSPTDADPMLDAKDLRMGGAHRFWAWGSGSCTVGGQGPFHCPSGLADPRRAPFPLDFPCLSFSCSCSHRARACVVKRMGKEVLESRHGQNSYGQESGLWGLYPWPLHPGGKNEKGILLLHSRGYSPCPHWVGLPNYPRESQGHRGLGRDPLPSLQQILNSGTDIGCRRWGLGGRQILPCL